MKHTCHPQYRMRELPDPDCAACLLENVNSNMNEIAMSLYNLVRGVNPNAGLCLAILGVMQPNMIPRFRDAWLGDDGKRITLLTRTGGGNREEYAEQNEWLKTLPGYIMDSDDVFDSTFARWIYTVPEFYQDDTALVARVLVLTGSSEETQGPGPMVEAMLKRHGEEVAPKPPQITAEHPEFVAGWNAYERLVAKLTPEAPEQ